MGGLLALSLSVNYVIHPARASGPSSNRVLNYQIRLTDTSGVPVADGTKNIKISFYDLASAGTRLHADCGTTGTPVGRKVIFSGGIGTVLIGDTAADSSHNCTDASAPNAIPVTLFSNTSLFIGISVEADAEMTPRKRVVATGYSLNADHLDDLDTSAIGGSVAFVPVTDPSGNLTLTKNLTVDGTTLFVDSVNNRVGIGLSSPQEPLHLFGAAPFIRIDDTGSGAAGLYMTGTVGGQVYIGRSNGSNGIVNGSIAGDAGIRSNHNILFSVNNGTSAAMYIENGGHVGISTSDPDTRLHVKTSVGGDIAKFEGVTGRSLRIGTDPGGTYLETLGESAATRVLRLQAFDSVGASYQQLFIDAPNQRVYVPSGNFGIGNSGPSEMLEVSGNILASSAGSTSITVNRPNFTSFTDLLRLHTAGTIRWGIGMLNDGTDDLHVTSDGSAAGTKLFIQRTTGNVGIGRNDRLSRLTVRPAADQSNIGGTTTASSSTTIVGTGTTFLQLGIGDRISLSSSPATYATVTDITNNVQLTVSAPLGDGTTQTINVKRSIFRLDDAAGTSRFLMDDLGNVGIGTTTPDAKLDVAGNIAMTGGSFQIVGENPARHILTMSNTVGSSMVYQAFSAMILDSLGVHLWSGDGASWAERLRINSIGNVGIGTITPNEYLEVAGGTRIGQGPTAPTTLSSAMTASDTTANVVSTTGYPATGTLLIGNEAMTYSGKTATTFTGLTRGVLGSTAATQSISNTVNNYLFTVLATPTLPRMLITGAGNVGIGISNPAYPLDVSGSVQATSSFTISGGQATLNANCLSYGTCTAPNSRMIFAAGNVFQFFAKDPETQASPAYSFDTSIATTQPLLVVKNNGSEKFRITGAGNVGIGTTLPTGKLHVVGGTAQSGTGTLSSSGTTVTGTGTSFTTELHVGDAIIASSQTRIVVAIGSNTSLTTDTAFAPALSGSSFTYQQPVTRLVENTGTTQFIENALGNFGFGASIPTSAQLVQFQALSGVDTLVGLNTTSAGGASELAFQENGANKAYVEFVNSGFSTIARRNNIELFNTTATGGIALHVNNSTTPDALLTSSGNFGIGTVSPTTFKLQVAGHVGPETDDTYDLGDSTHRWRDLYLGPATLHIGTSTSDEGVITYDTSTNKLQIDTAAGGSVDIAGGSGSSGCSVDASGNFTCTGTVAGGGGAGAFVNDGNSFGAAATLGTNDAFALNFETNNATKMTILSGGNVGIGTTSPSSLLNMKKTLTDGTESAFLTLDSDNTVVNSGTSIQFKNNSTGAGFYSAIAGIDDADKDGRLEFRVSNNGVANTSELTSSDTVMTIKQTGNVGVGATSPLMRLHVRGGTGANDGSSFNTLLLNNTAYGTNATTQMTFDIGEGANGAGFGASIAAVDTGSFDTRLDFRTRNNASHNETSLTSSDTRMTIDTNGNVGIGTTGPLSTLHVSGSGQARLPNGSVVAGNSPGIAFDSFSDTGFAANADNLAFWESGTIALDISNLLKEYRIPSDYKYAWSAATNNNSASDTTLYRHAAGVIRTPGSFIADGNVGIGTNNPLHKLHLVGQGIRVEVGGGDFPRFSLNKSDAGTDQKKWQNYASSTGLNFSALNDAENSENFWLSVVRGTGTAINNVNFPVENVAVGITDRLSRFTVKPKADVTNIGGTTTANATTTITGTGTTFTTSLGVGDRISLSSAASTYATVTAIASVTSLTVDAALGNGTSQTINQKQSIFRFDDAAGATKMVMNDLGNVGIGTAAPSAKLEIQGAGKQMLLTGGTLLGDGTENWLKLTGTLPAVMTNHLNGVNFDITSAGSSAFQQRGMAVALNAGYTGSEGTRAARFDNYVAGTGTAELTTGAANMGFLATAEATTTGSNIGAEGLAFGGNRNIGFFGYAPTDKAGAVNIGTAGFGLNTVGTQIGGYFGLQATTPTYTSAALIADNGATTSPVFLARDNGSTVFTIADGGTTTISSAGANLQVNRTGGAESNITFQIDGVGVNQVRGLAGGGIRFTDASSATEWMRVNSTGNVGIGTANPLTRLDLSGNLRTTGKATAVLTGSIDPAASTAVVGVGTLFTTQLVVGDRITVSGETRTVTVITNDTNLTVDTAFSNNANDTSPDVLYALHTARDSSNALKFAINDLGNVGIGTAAPTQSLDINGSARLYDQTPTTGITLLDVRAGAGQAASPVFALKRNDGSDFFRASIVNVIQAQLSGNGNPINFASDTQVLFANRVGLGATSYIDTTGGNSRISLSDLNGFTLDSIGAVASPNDLFNVKEAGTSRFIIDDAGFVGIGTVSPTEMLHVESATTQAALTLKSTAGSGHAKVNLDRVTSNTEAVINYRTAGTQNWRLGLANNTTNDFRLMHESTSEPAIYVTDAARNVGIGTDIPSSRFQVQGATATGTGTLTTSGTTTVTGSGTAFATEQQVGDTITAGGQIRRITAISTDTSLTVDTAFSPDLTGASFTYSRPRFVVQVGGLVGIGTASPLSQLMVQGQAAGTITQIIRGAESQTADFLQFQRATNGTVYSGVDSIGRIYVNNPGTGGKAFLSAGSGAYDIGNVSLAVTPGHVAWNGAVVRGLSGQSADLQQWQNDGGTALASVSASGLGTFSGLSSIGNINPSADNTYDLGTTALRWKTLHVGPGSVVAHNDTTNTLKATLGFSGSTAQLVTDAATPFKLTTGSNVGLNLDTAGNVGVGMTPSGAQLDINAPGTGQVVKIGTNSFYEIYFGGSNQANIHQSVASQSLGISTNSGDLILGAVTDGNHLTIKPSGNVGIGTTTPLTRLDLSGNLRTTGKATTVLTGSIDPAASTTVTGVGTLFTTQLVVGDRITVSGQTRTVSAIASDTSLTVETAFSDVANDTSPDVLYAIATFRDSSNAIKFAISDIGTITIPMNSVLNLSGGTNAGVLSHNGTLFSFNSRGRTTEYWESQSSGLGVYLSNATGYIGFVGPAKLNSDIADGPTAVASIITTSVTLSDTSAKLLSIRNNNVEKAYVDTTGMIVSGVSASNNAFKMFDGARLNFSTADTNAYFYRSAADTISTPGSFNVTGNVGFGTTTPLTRLDLAGNLRTTGKATAVLTGSIDPTASTTVNGVGTLFTTQLVVGDRITVTGETRTVTAIASDTSLTVDTAFTDNANDTSPDVLYALQTARDSGNALKFVINDLGNVGVGITAPPAQLAVQSGSDTTKGLIVRETATPSVNIMELQNSAGTAMSSFSKDGYLMLNTTTSGAVLRVKGQSGIITPFVMETEAGSALTISDLRHAYFGGNVGIGPSTRLSRLTIAPSSDVTDIGGTTTANASTTITGSGTTFLTTLGIGDRISLSSAASTYATVTAIASDTSLTVSAALGDGSSQTINKKQSVFRLDDAASATKLIMNDLGNVGVSTLDLTYRNTDGGTVVDNRFKIQTVASTSSVGFDGASGVSSINFMRTNTNSRDIRFGVISGTSTSNTAGAESGYLTFYTQTGGAELGERMRIDAAGNVGIGETAPDTRLHIKGADSSTYGQLEIESTGTDARLSLYNVDGAATTGRGDILMSKSAGFEGLRFMINNADKMIVDENGSVGIGTTAPNKLLDVAGAVEINLPGTGTANALCHTTQTGITNEEIVDCTGAPIADYAEMYPTAFDVVAGDIVALGEKVVTTNDGDSLREFVRATTPYARGVLGVVSDPEKTTDFNVIGYNIKDEDRPMPIALNGRVLTVVSTENGPIEPGDAITASATIPGAGMRATEAGMIVGFALDEVVPDTGGTDVAKILVFVNPGWWNGVDLQGNNATSGVTKLHELTVEADQDMKGFGLLNVGFIRGLGDLWSIDSNGKILSKELAADKVTAKSISVKQTDDSKTIGKATILAGSSAAVVENAAVKANSEIFVTFKKDPGSTWWVDETHDGSFIVRTKAPTVEDVVFIYLIIDVVDETTPSPAPETSVPEEPVPEAEEPAPEPVSEETPVPDPEPQPEESPEPEPEALPEPQ